MKKSVMYLPLQFLIILASIDIRATSDSNQAVAGAFESAGSAIQSAAESTGSALKSGAETIGAGVKSVGETTVQQTAQGLQTAGTAIASGATTAAQETAKGFQTAGTTIAAGVTTAAQETKKGFETAGTAIAKVATTAAEQTKAGFDAAGDEIRKDFSAATGKVKEMADKAANVFVDMGNKTGDFVVNKIYHQGLEHTVYEQGLKKGLWEEGLVNTVFKKGLVPVGGEVLLFAKIAAQTFRKWFGSKLHPDFCKNQPASLRQLPILTGASNKNDDPEGLVPYIIKYSPVVYLQSDEIYFPIWVTEWCTGPTTAIKTQSGQVVVPAGQVTMEACYELYLQQKRKPLTDEKTKLEAEKVQLVGPAKAATSTPAPVPTPAPAPAQAAPAKAPVKSVPAVTSNKRVLPPQKPGQPAPAVKPAAQPQPAAAPQTAPTQAVAQPKLTPAQDKRLKEINDRLEIIDRQLNWKYSGKPALNTGAKTPGEMGTIKYDEMYFDNADCVTYGSDPVYNSDAQGNLTTPCYVATSEEKGNIYIYYTYLYGFNAPYDVGPITGDTYEFQDAHEADYEHVTLELDKNTKALKRIFFAAHGTTEGYWLPANHPDISWEGTHPVSFSARGSHADYPREGTYVRIFGVANDITDKGTRWTPKLIRIFVPDDKRFDPKTMGWVVFPGTMGKRGVGVPTQQGWFMDSAGGNIGHDYNGALFCNNPSWGGGDPISRAANEFAAEAEYAACIASKIPSATPPAAAEW